MDEVTDQVTEDSSQVEGQAEEEQSEATEDVAKEAEPVTFEDHLGRKLTPEQLHKEYMKTQSYITKLEQDRLEWEKSAQKEASRAVSESNALKDVDPNVRDAIVQIVTPVIQDHLKQRDAESQRKAENEAFDRRLSELESKYKGGNGLPKFEKVKVLAAMRDPSNQTFDPELKFKEMNWSAILDYEIKQAIKGKSADLETEATGSSQARKPEGKTPKTWEDAAKSAYSRVNSN